MATWIEDDDQDLQAGDEDNPEGLIAYGVWHKVARLDERLVLIEVTMTQHRDEGIEEDEDGGEVLELDELSETWALAAAEQGAGLAEGEWVYFRYPDDDAEE